MELDRPLTIKATSPILTFCPSFNILLKSIDESKDLNISLAILIPEIIPFSFTRSFAEPTLSFGIQDRVEWSPCFTSSLIASLTNSLISIIQSLKIFLKYCSMFFLKFFGLLRQNFSNTLNPFLYFFVPFS